MKHHLLVAGTGRAGTSFLVQYLTACGLDTHLARNPEDRLDENANAGLEDFPTGDANLPYVIKSPWLYEFVDELLARDDIQVDAVIIPMRDLVEAATSRVVNELRARLGREDIPGELTRWHTWGVVPGGTVYSLNPIDQARLLSMGFHQVIHACVKKRVPLIFLEFPRFITDGRYLYEQLRPVLAGIDSSAAIRAHAQTAQPGKVRIGGELANSANIAKGDLFPNFDALDRVALHREIANARRDRDIHRAEAEHLRSLIIDVEQRLGEGILSSARIQLFVDEGNGFSEEHSSSQTIDPKKRSARYVFNVDRAIDIKTLRLDPIDDSAVLVVEDAILVGPNDSISLMGKLTSNCSFSADGILYFESKDPQIIFDDIPVNFSDQHGVRLEFQINLLKTGIDAQLACAKLAYQHGETRTRELEAEVTQLQGALHAHISAREEQTRLTQSLEDAHRQTLKTMQLELARRDTEHAAAMELLKAQFETATRNSDEQHTRLTQSLEDAHRQTLQALKQDLAQRDTQHNAAIELLKAQFEAAARISEEQQTALAQEYKTTNATLKASHTTALELQAEKQRAAHESAIDSLRSAHQNAIRAIEDRIREVIEQQIVELDAFDSTILSWFAIAESMLDQFDGFTELQRLRPIDVAATTEPDLPQQPAVPELSDAPATHSLGFHNEHASCNPEALSTALTKLASEFAQYEPSSRGSQSSLGKRYLAALASLRRDHAHAAEQFATRNHQLLTCQLENLAQAERKHGNEVKDLMEQIEALEATIETIRKWKGFRIVAWLNERSK
ncbi:coiled-coil domain-containing protein [Burkholderia cenocepacia]|uniref:hypothetical protein n=1 Tax=Burkholderia cenocepacia TaxID=95486 RepID=UPI001B95A3A1|nr:hypothetical protein [Burkholderia cenocepacia]MBR7943742.1 hypothetical protein [Burkholderia cenocepacia]MCW3499138.1 hypothetical protein [Burkholderia cenocepacia]MCW3506722.1 hypothetical protein [Burkholderia cenocepacia]MCW3514305.1 hypothetical protein [Burkholderia cenocepacia]MCW3530835.1 hypothetical protein [Burkholderia cenocepacia]